MNCDHSNHWPNIAGSGIWWCPDCGAINRGGSWVMPMNCVYPDTVKFKSWLIRLTSWWADDSNMSWLQTPVRFYWFKLPFLWPLCKLDWIKLVFIRTHISGNVLRIARFNKYKGFTATFLGSTIYLKEGGYWDWEFYRETHTGSIARWWMFGYPEPQ